MKLHKFKLLSKLQEKTQRLTTMLNDIGGISVYDDLNEKFMMILNLLNATTKAIKELFWM